MFKAMFTALACVLACGAILAADWPQFRGPDQNNALMVEQLKQDKTFGFELDWTRELGSGYSTISVSGQTGVTMYTDGTSDLMIAFDVATGEEKWNYNFGPMYKGHSGSDDGPTGTPTIYGDAVYAIDTHGKMAAVSLADGNELWSKHLGKDVKARVPHYGFSTVPLVLGDSLVVMTGDKEGRTFTAFNRKTGDELWASGDDTTTYQSPFILKRNGKEHLMGVTDNFLVELDAKTGKMLWKAEHGVHDNESYGMPVMLGNDRVLISDRRSTAAFQLDWKDGKAEMKELWRNGVFARTYAIPVVHNGYVFGFRAQFISCVDPATGETTWRSRPPGGQGLTLLGDQLLVLGRDGDLVAIEATHEAYKENARVKVFERGSYAAPTYADGYLYLRNLSHMARVKVVERETLAKVETDAPEFKGEIGAWFGKLMGASDKTAMIDGFMKKHKTTPIIEGKNLVHYVYRGDAKDLAVARGQAEVMMTRVPDTNFWFGSEEVDENGMWEYSFTEFGDPIIDPLNPYVIGPENRPRNELRMPGWEVPDYLGAPTVRGALEDFEVESAIRGDKRTVQIYLPHGYEKSDTRYPLMVLNNSQDAIETGKMDVVLDNLMNSRVAPVIVALVPGARSEFMAEHRDDYSKFLTSELIPKIDAKYRTIAEPKARGIMGQGSGGISATHTVFKYPGVFGKIALQSFAVLEPHKEEFDKLFAGNMPPTDFYVEISTNDYKFGNLDAEKDCRALVKMLKEKGVDVTSNVNGGAPGWGHWRSRTGPIMEWFAPKDSKNKM